MTKYKHTHTAFVEALGKILAERLFLRFKMRKSWMIQKKYLQLGLSIFMD